LISNAKLHRVNGVTIRVRRKQLGWSQVELGHRAGYSERVIRKAEAGGTLRIQTIYDIAMTLSIGGSIVSFHDLTSCVAEPVLALQASLDY
jgi:transcriptional regulator with XRE-family HTH domain